MYRSCWGLEWIGFDGETRIIERNALAGGFQHRVEEHAASDVLARGTARLEFEETSDVDAVFAARIDGASVQIEIANGAEAIQSHAHNTREI